MDLQKIIKRSSKALADNSPLILTSVAVGGVISTGIMAAKAGAKAQTVIWDLESEQKVELTAKEIVQVNWRLFVPAILMGASTITCIIGAHSINARRQVALVSAYSLSEAARREYQAKVVEHIGEKEERKITDAVAQDQVTANQSSGSIIISDKAVLCYDTFTGRYFSSDVQTIRRAENDINRQCINDMYASQNDFYRKIGLPEVAIGEEVGWTTDNVLEVIFSAVLNEEGAPCMALTYHVSPIRNYHKVW